MAKGFISLVLHAHLPFVRDRNGLTLAERWFYEAMTETYIPLLLMCRRLKEEGIPYRFTISLSPTLLSLMADALVQQRYSSHLEKLRELAAREVWRTRNQPSFHPLALMYQKIFEEVTRFYNEYQGNLIEAFKQLQEEGDIEIITCAATHGYLPLIGLQGEVVKAQIEMALKTYHRFFVRYPKGLWLPECAYNPGDEEILKRYGLELLLCGCPRPPICHPPAPLRHIRPCGNPFRGSCFWAGPGILCPGVERPGGLSRRLGLPGVLQGYRLRSPV